MTSFKTLIVIVFSAALFGYWMNPLNDLSLQFPIETGISEARIQRQSNISWSWSSGSYTPSEEEKFEDDATLPIPVNLFATYKKQHNAQVMAREAWTWAEEQEKGLNPSRKYAVAPYWCPDRSGNVLHNLFNTVTWAILTNRTILLQWLDSNPNRNTRSDCERVLRPRSWIPQWEEWKDMIPYSDVAIVPSAIDVTRRRFDEIHPIVLFPLIPDVFFDRGDEIYRNTWSQHPFSPEYRQYLEDFPKPHQTMSAGLRSNGVEFLYGMLFRQMFVLIPEEEEESRRNVRNRVRHRPDSLSVALHSRHVAKADDGGIISDEINCLRLILPNQTIHSLFVNGGYNLTAGGSTVSDNPKYYDNCTVYLLSDREATIDNLSIWMRQEYPFCHVRRTKSSSEGNTNPPTTIRPIEHGPNAGIGFFKDLAMGVQARTAIIGDHHHSSFKLLQELITYDRIMERVLAPKRSDDDDPWPDPLLHCRLPERRASGYDYGPGSFTYVQLEESLPELYPLRLWRLFRERHNQQVLVNEYALATNTNTLPSSWIQSGRRFSVADLPCPTPRLESNVQSFLNRVVWSLLSNRTLLVRSSTSTSPNCLSELPSWIPRWEEWSIKVNLSHPSVQKGQRPSLDSKVLEFPPKLPMDLKTKHDGFQLFLEYGSRFVFGMILRDVFTSTMERYSVIGRQSPQQILKRQSPVFSIAIDTRNPLNISSSSSTSSTLPISPILECLTKVFSRETFSSWSTPPPIPPLCQIFVLGVANPFGMQTAAQDWDKTITDHLHNMTLVNDDADVSWANQCKVQTLMVLPHCENEEDEPAIKASATGAEASPMEESKGSDVDVVAVPRDCSNDRTIFWQAWGWASQARHAWIGSALSMIPMEMDFQRVMEARSLGRFPLQVEELASCWL